MSDTNDGSLQGSACVNWEAALEAAAGDESLLAELVEMFANTEAPSLIADIDRSITDLDPVLLQRAAHTLKGSLRIFESQDASELCLQLESLGKAQLRKIAADRLGTEGKGDSQDAEGGQLEKLGKQYAAELATEDRRRLLEPDMHRAREIQATLNQTMPAVLEVMQTFLRNRAT